MASLAFGACLLLVAGSADVLLGTPLVRDGYSIRPPSGFTAVAELRAESAARGWFSAGLLSNQGQGPSSMWLASRDGELSLGPSSRDVAAASLLRFWGEELDARLVLEDAKIVDRPVQRIQILARFRSRGERRRLLLAAIEGPGRQVQVAFSVPDADFEALEPSLQASIETLQLEPGTARLPRTWVGALAGTALGALLVSLALRRRRKIDEL